VPAALARPAPAPRSEGSLDDNWPYLAI
jgi:hypothetical protein